MEKLKTLEKLKLLYVEDEDSLRESVSTGLGLFISDITIACNGQEGLEKFKQGDFDLVVSDIKMPKMDGVLMVKKIKELSPATPATPVIFTTAFTDTKYLLEAIELGVSRYVLKPIDIKLLLENIYISYLPVYQQLELEKGQKLALEHSKNSAMFNMVKMISHHWKQPLAKINVIASKVKILNETNQLTSDKLDEDMDKINNYSKSLAKTIDNFKDNLSQSRGLDINTCHVIDKVLEFFKPSLNDKNITIKRECLHNETIKLDQEKFLQLLIHIVTNSIEAFDEIEVDEPTIKFVSKYENSIFRLTIEDNAGGIHPNIKDRIFDMYKSTKSLNNRGLGLYFSKMIVEEHFQGDIKFEDVLDSSQNILGTQFIITIKLQKED